MPTTVIHPDRGDRPRSPQESVQDVVHLPEPWQPPDFYTELMKDFQVFVAVEKLGITPAIMELIQERCQSLRACFALPKGV